MNGDNLLKLDFKAFTDVNQSHSETKPDFYIIFHVTIYKLFIWQ